MAGAYWCMVEDDRQGAPKKVMAEVLGEADELLRGTLVSDVRGVEQEIEKGAVAMSAYVSGQVVPSLEQRAYDLYTFLVQAESDVRATLEASLEAHAIKERVERRMSVLGEQLWGDGEIVWVGAGRIDDVLYKREEAKPETSIVYGLVEE